jgi:hypothetical protein
MVEMTKQWAFKIWSQFQINNQTLFLTASGSNFPHTQHLSFSSILEPVIRPLTKSINKTLYNTNTKGFIFVWPSRMYVDVDESDMDVDSDECDQIEEKDKCCVCGKFEPDAVRKSV